MLMPRKKGFSYYNDRYSISFKALRREVHD